MGETNTTEPKKPSFAETIEPLARRYGALVTEDRQVVGKKREGLDEERSDAYEQMVDKTSRTILEVATREERKSIIKTAIDAFAKNTSEISFPESSKSFLYRRSLKGG